MGTLMPERKPLARCHSRDVRITFRATDAEAEELRKEAAERDIEVSRLIRRWLRMGETMDDAQLGGKVASRMTSRTLSDRPVTDVGHRGGSPMNDVATWFDRFEWPSCEEVSRAIKVGLILGIAVAAGICVWLG